tara:strand:+ start:279 stop:572 length:294 start_codon:yes stop_codon:yes gene_type:complete
VRVASAAVTVKRGMIQRQMTQRRVIVSGTILLVIENILVMHGLVSDGGKESEPLVQGEVGGCFPQKEGWVTSSVWAKQSQDFFKGLSKMSSICQSIK